MLHRLRRSSSRSSSSQYKAYTSRTSETFFVIDVIPVQRETTKRPTEIRTQSRAQRRKQTRKQTRTQRRKHGRTQRRYDTNLRPRIMVIPETTVRRTVDSVDEIATSLHNKYRSQVCSLYSVIISSFSQNSLFSDNSRYSHRLRQNKESCGSYFALRCSNRIRYF